MHYTIRILISLCLLTIIGCNNNNKTTLQVGEVFIKVKVDQSNFFTTALSVTNTDKYSVKILNTRNGEVVAYFKELNDIPSQLFLPQGQYEIVALSPLNNNHGDVVFKGKQHFTVINGNASILNIDCKPPENFKTLAAIQKNY